MDKNRISRFRVTTSLLNKDLENGDRQYYLDLVGDFKSSFPKPVVEEYDGVNVVREDLIEVGSKARFGELLIATCPSDTIVYVQPRFGFAGISLTYLCKMYGKKLVLFMPSSKEVSDHQAYCIEQGCEYHFHRIASMPNLNRIAERWAKENKAYFVPLGLKHELVTAMIVKTASEMEAPRRFWTAFSTGVLSRGLQIGWPESQAHGLAVARNIHDGEKGEAKVISHYKYFGQKSDILPPFPSASNYDAKVWEFVQPGDLFWNVAGEITHNLDKSKINSERSW